MFCTRLYDELCWLLDERRARRTLRSLAAISYPGEHVRKVAPTVPGANVQRGLPPRPADRARDTPSEDVA